ncbi:SusC/RagA family TonB-linked outer membrane protein [Sediminitomix flava]|uniref:TonB-linked SusC/RagA family outer membrane protein n=1 Tax=Sediminitomix flava TaxID=379075 RepID=A0A315ZC72_SEDFL|nr:TonB-dependent receptor [Sediminitomix flava]PWJ42912.1 TonB-linked SusC/RagA family outer membrane protein [Sediminitomix flava]
MIQIFQRQVFQRILFFGTLLLCSYLGVAQDKMITGVVKDANTLALPGVNIRVEGSNNGTITDFDGKFSLHIEAGTEQLIFSYIGYHSQTIDLGTQTYFEITMEEDVEHLEEIVVIGYQVQKKSVVTGAVATVKAEDIIQSPIGNASQALQGKTPGVLVAPVSGQPGAGIDIRVRGTGTNGNNSPLYVVDGIQMSDINFLNPNDIESIEVLKDAASSAIYGSRGANGVVLVSTKKGKEGRTIVTYDGYVGTQEAWREVPLMNAQEYMMIHNEGAINAGRARKFSEERMNNNLVDTNWQNELFKTAPIQNHSVQMSGGSEKSQFLASIGYFGQQGIVAPEKSSFDRYTLRLNSSNKVSDYVKVGVNATFSREEAAGVNEQNQFNGTLTNALLHDPLTPVWEDDPAKIEEYNSYDVLPANNNGRFYGISQQGLQEIVNPMAAIHNTFNERFSNKFLANAYLEIKPLKGLRFKTDIGVDIGNGYNRYYGPAAYYNTVTKDLSSSVAQGSNTYAVYQWENVLTYDLEINNHKINFLAGSTFRDGHGTGVGANGADLQFTGWKYAWVDNASGDSDARSGYGNYWKHRLASFFGKIGYDYKEKYLFSATARYDGSSRFGENNRFGFFPSVQMGWVISNEELLKSSEVMNFLKVRASWGKVGNENIGDFGYLELFSGTPTYPIGVGETMNSGYAITRMANPDLKWESAVEFNLGIDAGFWQDKLTTNIDFYSRNREGLLGQKPVPGITGVNGPLYNLGTVRNQGIEMSLTYSKREGEFHFDITANASYNDNKVMNVENLDGRIYGPTLFQHQGQLMMEEGYSLPYFYGFETNGIFQNLAEIEAHVGAEGQLIQPNAEPGDIRYVDQNGDGKIDNDDRTNIGSPVHSWMYGLNVRMDYKGFDFSMFWQGQAGGKLINATVRQDLWQAQNFPVRYLERWTGEGTTNSFPRFTYKDENNNFSNLNDMVHIEDASYLRLKNVQIGYTVPKTISSKAGMEKLRVYISGSNLLTFTEYSGMDPEVAHGGAWSGFDLGSYPQARTYLVGVNVTF